MNDRRRTDLSRWAAVAMLVAPLALPLPAVASAPAAGLPPLASVPSVDLARYLGTWYQVAWFPNRFQQQCASDTQARYGARADGSLDVRNACRRADGRVDDATGRARPVGTVRDGRLEPAQLQVSFLPAWLQWTWIGWGSYWVIELPDDYRYAVISEPTREYLWVLAREPRLSEADQRGIRDRLAAQGFDLSRWQDHPHRDPVPAPAR
jgi:apolipoprotein D and lipocalin family protein